MQQDTAALDALVARFAAGTLSFAEWTHPAHLTVGAWHVSRYGADAALAPLRVGILRLNEAHGTPNSDTRGYHETITRAYLVLIGAYLAGCPASMPLPESIAALIAGPLGDREILLRFYSPALLFSVRARKAWVEPDRMRLALV
jgi:hypothetical protein